MKTLVHSTAEQRFQFLMEAACDYAIFFTDLDGAIIEWSASAERIIGYGKAEALAMNGRVIFTAEDRGRRAPELEMESALRDGQANDERWHMRKDGSLFFAVGRLITLRDQSGHPVGFAKIIRDSTPFKTLEQALHASDEHFRATFAQAPIGMVLTDLTGKIQQVNATFCEMIGLADRELEGRVLLSLTAPEHRPAAERQFQEMFMGKRDHVSLEKRLVRANGSHVWVQNSASILRDAESRPLSMIDLMQDISPLKWSEAELARLVNERTSALRQKTKDMEAFCYTVAHDLRAPLRTIAGYAEFLREDFAGNLASEGLEYLRRIEEGAGRLDQLIKDLLGYTRIQQVSVSREDIDLTTIAARAAEQVKRDYPNEKVTIQIESPLGHARADGLTLEHVFLNLLSNAVKFRREGVDPEIHVHSEVRGNRQRIWVEDNGIGVDQRFQDRVFGMFERLNPERKVPGTGVGLAIVAMAMERLDGSRGVEPNYPAGSRFWIELPR